MIQLLLDAQCRSLMILKLKMPVIIWFFKENKRSYRIKKNSYSLFLDLSTCQFSLRIILLTFTSAHPTRKTFQEPRSLPGEKAKTSFD